MPVIGPGIPVYFKEQGKKYDIERKIMLKLYRHEMPEYLPIMGSGIINNVPVSGYLERAAGGRDGYDWFGVHWMWKEGSRRLSRDPIFLLKDIADWREIVKFPDLDQFDWEQAAKRPDFGILTAGEALLYQMTRMVSLNVSIRLWDLRTHCVLFMTDPEEVRAFLRQWPIINAV